MEARSFRAALLTAALAISMGASYPTPNFIVQTRSPQLAEQLGRAAEQYRRQLAIEWLGHEMPDWSQPCVMTVHAGPNLGAGGATTFIFDQGEVFGWRMTIQGSAQRLLDSVLPHEITHMIFASHFRRPLPRWADEGGATSVEHPSELAKHRTMLVRFLKTNRGIAFNRMFAMTEYPRDIMPLYAQGYSLAEFLIQQGGRRKYAQFLGDGMKSGQWSAAIRRHYGTADAGALQNTWLAWVRQGSPPLQPRGVEPPGAGQPDVLVAAGKLPRPEPNLIYRTGGRDQVAAAADNLVPVKRPGTSAGGPGSAEPAGTDLARAAPAATASLPASGWHPVGGPPTVSSPQAVAESSPAPPIRTQTAHPQPIEQSHQIILEWGRQ